MKKIGFFFGGMSNEHDVSIASAKNIIKYIDATKYQLILFYCTKGGSFYKLHTIKQREYLQPKQKIPLEEIRNHIDIALPMTHGKYGEDGNLQGIFERYNIPYCGCRMLGSALCMDKGMFKEYMKFHNTKQTKFFTLDFSLISAEDTKEKLAILQQSFSLPLYVKPANSGSSIGITKVESYHILPSAVQEARKHDNKVIIEEGCISPKEIEIAIVGSKELIVSNPGELILIKDFYNYSDKYKNNEAQVKIPANISIKETQQIKALAEKI